MPESSSSILLVPNTSEVFWVMMGALFTLAGVIVSALIYWVALKPIKEKAKLGKALFEDAVQVDVGVDGVFSINNIFTEPIVVTGITQELYRGSFFGVVRDAPVQQVADAVEKLNNFPFDGYLDKVERRLAPGTKVVYSGSKTHLPEDSGAESFWVVTTSIDYESITHVKRKTQFKHRFSLSLEPRRRWVEIL